MILAVDIGTSSSRAAVFTEGGVRVADSLVQREYAVHTNAAGAAELDPLELVGAVGACMEAAVTRVAVTPGAAAMGSVGMSCFWHSLLGVDEAGRALTPIYTWADSRCRNDAAALRAELDERVVHAETGCMLRASFWPAKLRWLRRTERELFDRVRFWISPAEWIQWQLAGSATCAVGMATGTGLFDPTAGTWSGRMLDACAIRREQLLPVSNEAGDWRGMRWFPGIGDGAASNLGSGATRPGVGAINVGTSAALRVMRSGAEARAPFGLFCYRVDSERFLVGGAVSNAGNLHAWCTRELRLTGDATELEKVMAARPTPDHGLTVLPFWTAERAPRWNEDDAGAILGIRQATTAEDLTQAIQEAFFYRLATIADAMQAAAPRWIVSGGVLRSPSALQRLANVLGAPIWVNADAEASLRGAAVYAIQVSGGAPVELPEEAPIEPDLAVHERYLTARARQAAAEQLLTGGVGAAQS